MKNKEKYTNTDDALKAFARHNKYCKCGCSFEEWLDMDDSPRMRDLGAAFAGIVAGSLMLGGLVDSLKDAKKDGGKPEEQKPEKPLDDKGYTGIECPVCHCKNGKITYMGSLFTCPDCNVSIGNCKTFTMSRSEYTDWIADLCKKNSKD